MLLVRRFVRGLKKLDPTGKKHHNDLSVLKHVTLEQLHVLDILEDSPIHIVSSCIPTTDDRIDLLASMLREDVTPLLSQHNNVITNLSSIVSSASGGVDTLPSGGVPVETNQVVTDDDSTGSTNTGSTTGSLANYASLNRLQSRLNAMDFWKAGREI